MRQKLHPPNGTPTIGAKGRYVTKTKFNDNIILLDVDSVFTNKDIESDIDVNRLSDVSVTPEYTAYIIFTSGSTGTPKAVR